MAENEIGIPEKDERTTDEHLLRLLNGLGKFLFHHRHPMVQDRVLQMLAANGPMSQKKIQEQLETKPGSCSELISKLESKGHIIRERDADDRRKVVIRLTERGMRECRFISSPQQEQPFQVLTENEKEELVRLLKKVLDNWTGRERQS